MIERTEVERILAAFAPGAALGKLTLLTGGVSSLMVRVDLERAGSLPERLIIRRLGDYARKHDPDSLRRENNVLRRAREAGVPAPPVLFADLEGEVLGEPLLVLEYLEGEVASRVAEPVAFARELADAMAAIHRIDVTGWGLTAPEPLSARSPEAHRPILLRAHAALAPHLDTFALTTLLHGDMWPGNLLVRDGRLVGVLDWEDARLGDPLIDIAIARLDLIWLYGEASAEAFVARMREHREVPGRALALADLYAALRPGSSLELWASAYPKIGRPDVTAATMRDAQDRFAEQALARL